MKHGLLGLLWVVLLAGLAHGVVVDRIVAVVNDQVITLSELDETAAPLYRRYLSRLHDPVEREKALQEIRRKVLQQMIDNLLVSQEAKKLDVSVSDEEVDRFIENMKRQNHLSEEDFLKFLADSGLTLEEYRKQVAEQLRRLKLVQSQVRGRLVVTDEEIADYYRRHYTSEEKTRYDLAAIIVQGPKAEERAREAYRRIKEGEDFARVAEEFSALKGSGRGLGRFSLEELSPEVRRVVQGLKPGEVSPPVRVKGGWHIYKLLSVEREGTKPLDEEMRARIEQELREERVDQLFQKWIKELREKSYIRILL